MANQNPATHNWTEERTERLKQLVREGYSAGWIAANLGGITRNAVIGKVTRIGMRLGNSRTSMQKSAAAQLRLKAHHARVKSARLKAPAAKIKFPVEALPPPNIEDIPRKTLADLEPNDCRYPVGEVGHLGFGFCALEQLPGSSYCPSHTARTRAAPIVRKPILQIEADTSAPVKEGADA